MCSRGCDAVKQHRLGPHGQSSVFVKISVSERGGTVCKNYAAVEEGRAVRAIPLTRKKSVSSRHRQRVTAAEVAVGGDFSLRVQSKYALCAGRINDGLRAPCGSWIDRHDRERRRSPSIIDHRPTTKVPSVNAG